MVREHVEVSRQERFLCYNIIEDFVKENKKNFLQLENIFECFTINSKIVRELESKAQRNPIRRDPDTDEEHLVVSPLDLQIIEALFLARYYVQKELREDCNISVLLH